MKVYEFEMVLAPAMEHRSREGWEFVGGPVAMTRRTRVDRDGATWCDGDDWACLMRREVVPARDLLSRPYVDDHPLRNCWTCKHGSSDAIKCDLPFTGNYAVGDWVAATHDDEAVCPRDADGCPGWAPKATP